MHVRDVQSNVLVAAEEAFPSLPAETQQFPPLLTTLASCSPQVLVLPEITSGELSSALTPPFPLWEHSQLVATSFVSTWLVPTLLMASLGFPRPG